MKLAIHRLYSISTTFCNNISDTPKSKGLKYFFNFYAFLKQDEKVNKDIGLDQNEQCFQVVYSQVSDQSIFIPNAIYKGAHH